MFPYDCALCRFAEIGCIISQMCALPPNLGGKGAHSVPDTMDPMNKRPSKCKINEYFRTMDISMLFSAK